MFTLISRIISFIISYIEISSQIYTEVYSKIYFIGVLVPTLAVGVRRMHDVGKSAWFILIPIYNLILACTDSEHGPNKWGNNPKGTGYEDLIGQIGKE